jgi:hypothetical protein
MDAFAFVLRANRRILAGDEITISYIPVLSPFNSRQKILETIYGFRCKCPACKIGPYLDLKRAQYVMNVPNLDRSIISWASNLSLSDDHLIAFDKRRIEKLEYYGLSNVGESWLCYALRIHYCYLALGDEANAKLWLVKYATGYMVRGMPEQAQVYMMKSARALDRSDPLWELRVRAKQAAIRDRHA